MVPKIIVDAEIKRITGLLLKLYPDQRWAFVVYQGQTFYAVESESLDSSLSPVVILLQQVFEKFKDHSFFILRQRIYTNYLPNLRDLGMSKVVAKRISQIPQEDLRVTNEVISEGLSLVQFQAEPLASLSDFHYRNFKEFGLTYNNTWELLSELAALNPRGVVLHDYDRSIAAVLLNQKGEVVSFGLNSNHLNKTLHAEVNLIQKYLRDTGNKQIPKGYAVYVTHKPCKMCAAMIYDFCEERDQPFVYYEQDVPGSLSSHTVLDKEGLNQQKKAPI